MIARAQLLHKDLTMARLLRLLALALPSLLVACSGGELVGIHLLLAKDGSGTVTTRSLVQPTAAGPSEAKVEGVSWTARASLVAVQGSFAQLGDVRVGKGLRFTTRIGEDQPSLRVFVQRGPDAAWLSALVPDETARRAMAKVYDPTGKTREVGDTIRLEIEVPGEVIASAVQPGGRGVEADRERRRAFLLLPARTMAEAGDELVWDVTWR